MTKRLFSAIKINAGQSLQEIINEFRVSLKQESIKWVEIHNIHITLKFFGDIEENEIPKISSLFQSVASKINTFEMTLEKAGYFGPSKNPRIIWFGIKGNSEMSKLVNLINSGLSEMGYADSEYEFKPHLTIGRIKFIKEVDTLKNLVREFKDQVFQTERISEFRLYESILLREGPIYKVVECYKFQG